jgi:cardiolipin synthase
MTDLRRAFSFASLALATVLATSACGAHLAPVSALAQQPIAARAQSSIARTPTRQPCVATAQNDAKLYVTPAETFPAVKALINSANHSLYLETFNFGTEYAQDLAPLLIAKAKAGVEVKLLIDEFGSHFLKGYDQLVKELRAGGVTVQVYRPYVFSDAGGHLSFNITHRKLYMADGRHVLVGGVNLASPFEITTQDLLIDWQGPVVGQLMDEYRQDWRAAGGGALAQTADVTPAGTVEAKVLVSSPVEGRYEIRDAIYAAVDAAKHDIVIEQQYLWEHELINRLEAACKRGVAVRIIIPGNEQMGISRNINCDYAHRLELAGAQVHMYQGLAPKAHLHTKYFGVDGAVAFTGSCNGDERAFIDNQELDIVTTTPSLVSELHDRLFERDWQSFSNIFTYVPGSFIDRKFMSWLDWRDYYL